MNKQQESFRVFLGICLFFTLFLFGIIFSPKGLPIRIVDERENLSHKEKLNTQKIEEKKILVRYEIEYGSMYTGDQTSVVHKGTTYVLEKTENGFGENGLPIHGWMPAETRIPINFFNSKGILHVPTVKTDNGIVASYLERFGVENPYFVDVHVSKIKETEFLVSAKVFQNKI